MYVSGAIANYFLDRGEGEDILISPMKVIKLSYLAHGWYLAFTDNNTLVNEDVEAWDHGPVLPSLYQEFRNWGAFPIEHRATELRGIRMVEATIFGKPDDASFPTRPFLNRVWEVYKGWTASELRNLTHKAGSPWHTVKYSKEYRGKRTIIDNDLIYRYYKAKLDE